MNSYCSGRCFFIFEGQIYQVSFFLDFFKVSRIAFQVMLGDVESERDNLVEKLSDFEKVRNQLSEFEEREAIYIKSIEDLKTQQAFVLVSSNL